VEYFDTGRRTATFDCYNPDLQHSFTVYLPFTKDSLLLLRTWHELVTHVSISSGPRSTAASPPGNRRRRSRVTMS
jgi:hypothetical protein